MVSGLMVRVWVLGFRAGLGSTLSERSNNTLGTDGV